VRYYDIVAGSLKYTSLGANGSNPGALNIECDIGISPGDVVTNGSFVRVWGIDIADIKACKDLYGQQFTMKAGMQAGLPLANAAQSGVISNATIFRAFGNWILTDMTVDFILQPSGSVGTPPGTGPHPVSKPQPIILNWKKGQPLIGALQQALSTAFPNFKIAMNIGKYIAPSDQIGFHHGLANFSYFLRRYTQMLSGKDGVSLTPFNGVMTAHDETYQQTGGTINYQDLIGQPTWVDLNQISIKTVMRADLRVGQTITLPQTIVTNTVNGGVSQGASGSPLQSLTYQGQFSIVSLRHLGNFRQPDAASWCTVITANVAPGSGSSGSSSGGSSGSSSGGSTSTGSVGPGGIGHQ
jgi:hypothetical protein